ncbi:MAG: methyl-accepting chemotaxis protein [Bryobacteraceae bacterium]|nr:methyl-accepting chemotaxis protein [Bryobacteraceae bacterium]
MKRLARNGERNLQSLRRHRPDRSEACRRRYRAGAIGAISDSSNDIARIIKTVEEIAFQTNILALNAAVEAARAGECGAGFAVVAHEVRNLAHGSSEAARETASLIETSVSRAAEGVEQSRHITVAFKTIVERCRAVDSSVGEIAAATGEQRQGITQLNTAVAQLSVLTQSLAADADRSAHQAGSLNDQAEVLQQAVGSLARVVR